MLSIPQTIYPIYSIPPESPVESSLHVGAAIKDLPIGSETEMKKHHSLAIISAKKQFKSELSQYEENFKVALLKAVEAEKIIGDARQKKIIAITLLVGSIITVVGSVIAATVTGTLPLAFIAAPFLVGIIPSSYYIHIFRKQVSKLEHDIKAPNKLYKPALNLPIYNQKNDLDLAQSRLDVQNQVAMMSICELAKSSITKQITSYALLDRVTRMSEENRPHFYAKCIQLINANDQILKEYNTYAKTVESEFKKMNNSLKAWKNQQDFHIANQESNLLQQDFNEIYTRRERPLKPILGLSTVISKWDLENFKTEVAVSFARRDSENRQWFRRTSADIETAFEQARKEIESQYVKVKRAAA